MKEEWRDVKNFEGLYQVSNFGRVKSLFKYVDNNGGKQKRREKILAKIIKTTGYIQATLSKNGNQERVLVHRLVAEAFLPNTENKPQINHKDGNPNNNVVLNLEWCTPSENGIHAYRVLGKINWCKGVFSKYHPTSKSVIQKDFLGNIIKIWDSGMDAVREGFESSAITRCCQGKSKTHKGFKWEYSRKV